MNGPKIVCSACGGPTTFTQPICNICLGAESGPPVERCELCGQGYAKDRFGLHTTAKGGYVGKCRLPVSISGHQE